MAINLRLADWQPVDDDDPWNRPAVGWRADLTDQQLWEVNRGVWTVGDRAEHERFATLSYGGTIRVVVALTAPREPIVFRGRRHHALVGRVLSQGDPAYDTLLGRRVGRGRNPSYLDTRDLDGMLKHTAAPEAGPRFREHFSREARAPLREHFR